MEEELKKELANTLQNDSKNYSKIQELSNKLLEYDNENVRFSVDAGIIDRLGKELVAKHETAVSELVKNAYDADATKVQLIFKESYRKGGSLQISDNGLGMTKEQLINGFMRLSSSEKLHYPRSPKYNRKRAGKKGIGRFSAQRLGTSLRIVTQTLEAKEAIQVTIDWNEFLGDKDLSNIQSKIEYIEKTKPEGTSLFIDNLRDNWTEAQIKRVYRYASETLQPFPLSKKKKDVKFDGDPGFKLHCTEIYEGKAYRIASEENMFFEHALAEIDANVDNDGFVYLTIKSKKLDFKENKILLNSNEPYSTLKNVSLKAYYFIYSAGLIPKQSESYIREKSKTQGGIRLYRNGFRVLPYGESDDDWLGLDASVRRRSVLPVHGNINFFGFVEVDNDFGEQFEELSSREGLIENISLSQLKDFGYKVLVASVNRVASVRGKKLTTGQKDWNQEVEEETETEPEEIIDDAIEELKEIVTESEHVEVKDDDSESTKNEKVLELLENIESAQQEQKRRKKEFIEDNSLLRVLASLGLTIGEFIHEIKQYQGALQHDVRSIENSTSLDDAKIVNKRVKEHLEGLNTYTSYFDEAFSENVQRELKPIELRTVVNNLKNTVEADFDRRNIDFIEPVFNGYHLYTIPMHKSEWSSILFNLYTNARKAIHRANTSGKIFIECGKSYNNVYLEFSDNGDGIPVDKREEVFNAFYTTSMPVGKVVKTYEEMTGTGLGLKIVKDIINGYNGKIFVKEPTKGYSTTFRIEIPWEKEGYKYEL